MVVAIDQEILLLDAERGVHGAHVDVAEQLEEADGALVERLERTQQRRLVVEALTVVADEHRRHAQRAPVDALDQEHRRAGIPRGVAARLERGAYAAGGNELASGSPWMSCDPENRSRTLSSPGMLTFRSMKLSCFSAVSPVIGWNQWVK